MVGAVLIVTLFYFYIVMGSIGSMGSVGSIIFVSYSLVLMSQCSLPGELIVVPFPFCAPRPQTLLHRSPLLPPLLDVCKALSWCYRQ
jgi:hypothetical protein